MNILNPALIADFDEEDERRVAFAAAALSRGLYLSVQSDGLNEITERLRITGMAGLDPQRDRFWDLDRLQHIKWDERIPLDA